MEVIARDLLREQYKTNFDAEAFFAYFSDGDEGEAFLLRKLYQYFSKGQLKGSTALEFGCGPIIHRMGPASMYYDSLVFSDFSDRNREYVQDWLNRKSPDPNFKHLFHLMALEENFSDAEAGAVIIENRIKSKVSKILYCDVHRNQPLEPPEPAFDLVFSGGCLESACLNYEEFVVGLKNLSNLVKPGGYLILTCYLNGKTYQVADYLYPSFDIKTHQINDALVECGYQVIDIGDIYPAVRPRPDWAPSTGVAIAFAKKSDYCM